MANEPDVLLYQQTYTVVKVPPASPAFVDRLGWFQMMEMPQEAMFFDYTMGVNSVRPMAPVVTTAIIPPFGMQII